MIGPTDVIKASTSFPSRTRRRTSANVCAARRARSGVGTAGRRGDDARGVRAAGPVNDARRCSTPSTVSSAPSRRARSMRTPTCADLLGRDIRSTERTVKTANEHVRAGRHRAWTRCEGGVGAGRGVRDRPGTVRFSFALGDADIESKESAASLRSRRVDQAPSLGQSSASGIVATLELKCSTAMTTDERQRWLQARNGRAIVACRGGRAWW